MFYEGDGFKTASIITLIFGMTFLFYGSGAYIVFEGWKTVEELYRNIYLIPTIASVVITFFAMIFAIAGQKKFKSRFGGLALGLSIFFFIDSAVSLGLAIALPRILGA